MNPFRWHFQRDIIAARTLVLEYGISYRELQEMLAQRE